MDTMKKMFKNWGGLVANSKSRWATIFIWILLIGIFSIVWPQVNDREKTDNQLLSEDAMSIEAGKLQNEEFSDDAGTPLLLVWNRDGGLETSDFEAIQAVYGELDEDPVAHQTFVATCSEAPTEALMGSASDDGAALSTPVFFDDDASTDQLHASLEDLQQRIEQEFGADIVEDDLDDSGLHVRFSGPVGIQTDA